MSDDDDVTRRDVLRGIGGLAVAGAIGCDAPSDIETVKSAVLICTGSSINKVNNAPFTCRTSRGTRRRASPPANNRLPHQQQPVLPSLDRAPRMGHREPNARLGAEDVSDDVLPRCALLRLAPTCTSKNALGSAQAFSGLTLECWVRPFVPVTGASGRA